ncbi:MAG: hypothetical protein HY917_05515 [Candidatus Diapherotrites archaeon]|nr:hypothetical protein [Candidatus Diapherotrites archaeon]
MQFSIVAVSTLDGRIARHSFQPTTWGSPEDKIFLRRKLNEFDVIVVGNNTYKTARSLKKRNCVVFTRSVKSFSVKGPLCTYVNPSHINLKRFFLRQGYEKIGLLGGTQVYDYFNRHGWLDEIFLTIEPLAFGKGLSLFAQSCRKAFRLLSLRRLNRQGSVLFHFIRSEAIARKSGSSGTRRTK